jgi:hypothetical protein
MGSVLFKEIISVRVVGQGGVVVEMYSLMEE